ncbi:hypothetical protein Airi02_001400 [Actinoallomurus iriomotensis]|uniref:Coenzyme Q-binding protein COQ10 START domain-containing protein n=1 Tax=Actinoallomurus iriomotensis TaxID=478107 RepID=A0A9W6VRG1_9ACTN|nr:hypothetical protein Airi02_001400 [Actinoallomurus iriomotensis]
MATRSASKKDTKRPTEHTNLNRLKELKGTVETATKTVKAATNAVNRGKAAPKAAISAAKSLGSGGSTAKHAVSGGLDALKKAGEKVLGKKSGQTNENPSKITNILEEIDVGAPRRLVYDQWTRFQDFPGFTKKVEGTEQVSDEKLRWKAKIFWSSRSWESTIIEQIPDERVVWRSTGAKGHVDGAVTFHELTPDLTRVLLVLEYHPKGLFEKTGNLWRAQGRRVRLELKHFQRHVMAHAVLAKEDDTEGWRGEIRESEVVKSHETAVAEEKKQQSNAKSGGSSDTGKSSGSTRSRKSSSTGRSSSRSSNTKRSSSSSSSGGSSSGGSSSKGSSSGTKRSSSTRKTSDKQES